MTAYNERHVSRQRRAQGYMVASAVPSGPGAGRCRKCRHFADVFRPRCAHGDFPVTKNASCVLWVTR